VIFCNRWQFACASLVGDDDKTVRQVLISNNCSDSLGWVLTVCDGPLRVIDRRCVSERVGVQIHNLLRALQPRT
jgi:hypothetical protein